MSSSSATSLEKNATRSDSSVYSAPMSSSSAAPACSPAKSVLNLVPGYHFVPTDHELVVHYLRPRLAGIRRLPLPVFVYERILNYHPDELIEKYRQYGEDRWFFFTVREPKHSGGNRPNRTTPDNGHWNATGSIKPIRSARGVLVGCRRTLVFYEAPRGRKKKNQAAGLLPAAAAEEEVEAGDGGQAAKQAKDGDKTEWTMYEYESLSSEAEFEAIRTGNANRTDVMVLCTIQKKKQQQEEGGDGETKKKSTKRKTKEEALEQEAVSAATGDGDGDVEHRSRAGTSTTEGQDEDHVQAPAGVLGSFNVDPDQQMNMPYYYLTNSLSSSVPTHSQETTVMAPAAGGGDNHTVMMHQQQNYYFINHSTNMKNSQSSFHVQETPPQEFLPYYYNTKMAAPRGGGNAMDHIMVQNRFINMASPSSQAPPVLGTCLSPARRSESDVWERYAELPGDKPSRPLKSESSHRQAKLSEKEVNSTAYVSNSLSVPTPHQQETVMAFATRGYNHTVMLHHQQNYLNHSMNTRNSHFHAQATLAPEEFLPCSGRPLVGGGNVVVDHHHVLQNKIVNMTPAAAEAHTFNNGYGPGLSNSSYGGHGGGGDCDHLGTIMGHPEPPRFSFHSQGPLLNNQVSLNHQNSAASRLLGYDHQRNGVGLYSTQQDRLR